MNESLSRGVFPRRLQYVQLERDLTAKKKEFSKEIEELQKKIQEQTDQKASLKVRKNCIYDLQSAG